jgi:hypothetical protein
VKPEPELMKKYYYAAIGYLRYLIFSAVILMIMAIQVFSQTGSIKGQIEDSETGEPLIGATVLMQGTTKGAVTDVDGNYIIKEVNAGTYNLVISYVSYEQQILRVEVAQNAAVALNIALVPSSVEVDAVKIVANKRNDTEMALISNMRVGNIVANGISRQQISRSQDKDASEVISRVPGVTVRDGRFINVRGLDERYNVVNLNGVATPSSEADRRAFSFDMLPSSLIDNLVLLKTPAPEIPADFAGAMVQIQTKNTVENNSFEVSYNTGYRYNTTFNEFYTYKGGKTDWLGFDDGTRKLPADFPATPGEFRDQLVENPDENAKARITALGRAFSKTWSPEKRQSLPDQSFSFTLNRKFLLGKVSVGNITSVGYSTGDQYREVFRAGYQAYDVENDRPDTAFYFNDDIYSTKTKINGLFNWLFVFGNNQKIEFRNFFNNYADKKTILRLGRDNYGGIDKAGSELSFQSRAIYSGQLSGNFNFRQAKSKLDLTLGYNYTDNFQPDIRRIEMNKNENNDIYSLSFNFNADPKMLGRLYLTNYEHIYMGSLNYSHTFQAGNIAPIFKAGFLTEHKSREFVARNIGFAFSNAFTFNWNLAYQPIDSVFQDKNINFTDGIKIDESTNPTDSYKASNELYAAYAALDFPLGKLRIYGGLRVEKNTQILEGMIATTIPYKVNNDFLDFFPSVNMTYNVNEKSLLRFAWGKTVNRPEFREISMQSYYDFEQKATIYGNPELTNAYIQNVDVRYEFFPSNGDVITAGGFYKHFKNPIEAHLESGQSGWNYGYDNAREANSYGLEIDLRKSLSALESRDGLLRMLRHMVLVFNVALIKSELRVDTTTDVNARETVRQMQGQSPYIINTGLFYDNPNRGLMISMLYNVIGPRIMFVGDKDDPHVYQMPRHLIDITLHKKLGNHVMLKAGIKDLFNQPVELRQNERVQLIPVSGNFADRVQRTQVYKPSSSFMIGLVLSF